eukprot:2561885-Prorocentrum_lima.AAC.1
MEYSAAPTLYNLLASESDDKWEGQGAEGTGQPILDAHVLNSPNFQQIGYDPGHSPFGTCYPCELAV